MSWVAGPWHPVLVFPVAPVFPCNIWIHIHFQPNQAAVFGRFDASSGTSTEWWNNSEWPNPCPSVNDFQLFFFSFTKTSCIVFTLCLWISVSLFIYWSCPWYSGWSWFSRPFALRILYSQRLQLVGPCYSVICYVSHLADLDICPFFLW